MKVKIGIFGRVNAGKSTLFNALSGQSVAIVSPLAGTTTDPVRRAYELLGFGAVTLIDTAGFDDTTELGQQRLRKTLNVANEVDLALFVLTTDQADQQETQFMSTIECPIITVRPNDNHQALLAKIVDTLTNELPAATPFFGDLLLENQRVLLVCPIDSEAPEGRLILPQVQALRAALDLHCTAMVVQVDQLGQAIEQFCPHLVVTDSQAFDQVTPIVQAVGPNTPLTSFSILLAAQKGDPQTYQQGLLAIDTLNRQSKILLIEHCSHGVSCQDIARVKIPALLQKRLGFMPAFDIVSGRDPLPDNLSNYALAVQCGGCMAESRPIMRRIERCKLSALPITNYGILLRELHK